MPMTWLMLFRRHGTARTCTGSNYETQGRSRCGCSASVARCAFHFANALPVAMRSDGASPTTYHRGREWMASRAKRTGLLPYGHNCAPSAMGCHCFRTGSVGSFAFASARTDRHAKWHSYWAARRLPSELLFTRRCIVSGLGFAVKLNRSRQPKRVQTRPCRLNQVAGARRLLVAYKPGREASDQAWTGDADRGKRGFRVSSSCGTEARRSTRRNLLHRWPGACQPV